MIAETATAVLRDGHLPHHLHGVLKKSAQTLKFFVLLFRDNKIRKITIESK